MSLTFRRTCLLAALALLATFAPLARPALAAPIVVANFNNAGAGSLRQAIIDANTSVGGDTITFSAAGTINLTTPLPALTGGNISIDGSVPAGSNVPRVEIRGQGTIKGAGILIHSSGNTVRGLILNGFIKEDFGTSPDYGGAGVIISGSTNGVAANNIVEYNYIGTNAAGNAIGSNQDSNNVMAGVLIILGASTNTIRNNVISSNLGPGIYLTRDRNLVETYSKTGNVIRDNLIGLTADGGAALPNGTHGIWVGNNSLNTVIGPGNTISGNGLSLLGDTSPYYGLQIKYEAPISPPAGVFFPSGTLVKGNRIGTNAAGNAAVANKSGGVMLSLSTNTTIGGTSAADPNERNIISGNRNASSFGVAIEDYPIAVDAVQRTIGAVVQNNWIGIDASGTAALPNRPVGVLMRSHIRGARVGPGNVISGNGNPATSNAGYGVLMEVTSSDVTNSRQANSNEISGNLIGTAPDGNSGFAFQDTGIQLHGDTTANVIKNNRITANQVVGVDLQPNTGTNGPSGNTIQDNQIGVTVAGGTPGNGTVGIQLIGVGNLVGPGNDIAGHATSGIDIAASQNTVKGNTVRSNQIGIQISNGATGNVIGGPGSGNTDPSEGNNLINNSLYGVYVNGAGTINNKITRTRTNNNGDRGIRLDTGGNAPIVGASLSNLALSGNNLSGMITNSAVCGGSCTIEVFTSNGALVDEGPVFLTAFTSAGSFSNIPLPDCQLYLIFTITDSAGNTSEFINPIGPFAQCVPAAPAVSITTDAPGAARGVVPGSSTTYLHTVTNSGNGPGAVNISFSQTGNPWATLINNTCTGQILAATSGTCSFAVQVSVPAGTPAGQSNVSTINVSIGSAPGQQIDTTTALPNPALTFDAEPLGSNSQTVGSGQPVTYQHKLTNTGNGPDSFDITVPVLPSGWTFTAQPANPISLAQNASTIVTVVLTPPAGIAASSYAATVRATSRSLASVFAEVTDTTIITAAAVPKITSVVTPANADQGTTVTIDYTVANVGNQDGTFTLAFTPPPGWTVTQAAPPSVTVPFSGAPATFSVILLVPAAAIAGAYPAKLTATATSTPFIPATLIDQITVNQKAALTLDPDFNDLVLRAPNSVITYTNQLLTNNGNFTDTIHLVASTSIAGWSAQPLPATITLNPGASAIIPIVLTIPLGQLVGTSNTTTVTATSSLPATFDKSLITTTIDDISGALFNPKLPQAKVIDAGKPITFTFTLINSGSVPQSYTLTQAGAPGGWSSTLTPASPTITLAPGANLAVTLVLQAPLGTPDNTQATVTITATCNQKTCPAATATAQLTIGPPFSVGVGGNCDGPALPGAVLTCVHTVTNTGFSADTYLITALSPLGWSTAVAPTLLFLAPSSSGTVTLTLNVPSSAEAGLVHRLTFTARSTALPTVSQPLTDTTTVLQVAGVSFSPSRITPTIGRQLVQFQHTVLNTGNGLDTYTITATQTLDWNITIVPTTTVALPRGTYQTIQVSVQVPPGATTVVTNRIRIRATSDFAPAVSSELLDIIGDPANGDTFWRFTYLPIQR